MLKLVYLLLFIFDMVAGPIAIIGMYVGYSITLMYFCIKGKESIMEEMINYNKWFVKHIAAVYTNSMKVHKKRILGD